MTVGIFEFSVLSFVSLMTMLNPLGIIPVYVSMTSALNPKETRVVAFRAVLVALVTLFLFAVGGKFIFDFFHISVNSLRLVGGFIFFLAGYDMFNGQLSKANYDNDTKLESAYDSAITPIGIPLICGPGSITTVMLLMQESEGLLSKTALFVTIFLALAVMLLALLSAKRIIAVLGESGKKVLLRIMGLIVMVIAVDFFVNGIKPIIIDIING